MWKNTFNTKLQNNQLSITLDEFSNIKLRDEIFWLSTKQLEEISYKIFYSAATQ